jgi:Rieske Fe-S protein
VHVKSIEGGKSAHVQTSGGRRVTAHAVVVATNSPVNDRVVTHTKQAPYTTYVVGLSMPHGAVTPALYWDTVDPYHYVRLQPFATPAATTGTAAHDVLIVGGEDHKSGQADDQTPRFAKLEAWARDRFPMAGEVRYRWAGQVMETIDGLAFIGPNPLDETNVFIATGDSGMGMTHGTIAGMLLTDLIVQRPNPWADVYDPSRKPVRALGEFVKENLNVARQYADWLTSGDVSSATEIPHDDGAVLRRGVTKIAVYRDAKGNLHERSAVCPHLGCIVHWNRVDRTWDCPCHGSRFDRFGAVINGPANQGLADVEKSADRDRT